jgi:hypothetical protein
MTSAQTHEEVATVLGISKPAHTHLKYMMIDNGNYVVFDWLEIDPF